MPADLIFDNLFQGRPGDKGQKGESGNPGFDVYAAVKVIIVVVGISVNNTV